MTSQWFGDYEIIRQLRVGGMATLYLARRHGAAGFSRLVALKMIHPNLVVQPSFVEMFVDEARICSQISHPNVVHVEEFGVVDGAHYLVMEYVDGCSLNELLRVFDHDSRTLDPELAAAIVAQIAGGLHAAHETRDQDGQPLEVIHRDISPSNILLSVAGNAKLIDFGIAKARNRLCETQELSLKGKYKYVAPEQATVANVDRRCDIFSLGLVFWELLVGKPPFAEDTAVALFRRLHQTDVPPPSSVNPDVPAVFDPIVLAMLQHDPAQRPDTAAEVQRRIMLAAPGAANREAAELGAVAVAVRDRRAAWQAARRAAGVEVDPNNHVSFSPMPRSQRTGSGGSRSDIVQNPVPVVNTAPTWIPRDRTTVLLGLATLLVFGMLGGVWLGRRGLARAVESELSHAAAPARSEVAAPPAPRPASAAGGTLIGAAAPELAPPVPELAPPVPEPAVPEPAAPAPAAPTATAPTATAPAPAVPEPAAPKSQRHTVKSVAAKSGAPQGARPARSPTGNPARNAPPPRSAAPSTTPRHGPAIIRGFDSDGEVATPGESDSVKLQPPIIPGFDRASE